MNYRGPLEFGGQDHVEWTLGAAIVVIIILALLCLALFGCAGDGAAVKAPLAVTPDASDILSKINATNLSLQKTVETTTKQLNEAISAAANAAKTVNGNQITNQGMSNAQIVWFCCFGAAILFVVFGVLAPIPSHESWALYIAAVLLILAGVAMMQPDLAAKLL
jgi:threonine/homoserine/homoserine lactone efflux protein